MSESHKYRVTFLGINGDVSVEVETPLEADCQHEDNVNAIMDMCMEIAYLQHGADFRERLDTYEIFLMPLDV